MFTTINIPQGAYRGSSVDGISSFHNIPFTAPYQRFESPRPVPPASSPASINDATRFGAICPQNPSRLELVMGPMPPGTGLQSEQDCGVLSVYRPDTADADTNASPVIVWIHGGAFVSGGSQIPLYEGSRLARDGNVIVVCLSYRLGVFGFLFDEERSLVGPKFPLGTEDIILGFEWVHKNIKHFGGDAKNVTALGQSAGGYHIQCLLDIRPDLFQRAIIQSSPANMTLNGEQARAVRDAVVENLPPKTTLNSASAQVLLSAQTAAIEAHPDLFIAFAPTTTHGIMPGLRSQMGNRIPKDILCGWTKDDGAAFTCLAFKGTGLPPWMQQPLAKETAPAMTKKLFSEGTVHLAEHLRKRGDKVRCFTLNWEPQGFDLGATHCCDLPLLFGNEECWRFSPMLGAETWVEWERRGTIVRQAWGRFASEGIFPVEVEGLHIEDLTVEA